MKNITRTLSVIAILAIALTGFSWKISTAAAGAGKRATAANAPIRPEAYRIGVVNRKKAFDDFEKQQAAWAKLEKERETKQAVVDKQSDAIIAAQKKLAEDKRMVSTKKDWRKEAFHTMVALGESTTAGGWSTSPDRSRPESPW